MRQQDKKALERWEKMRQSIRSSTQINTTETPEQRTRRRAELEKDRAAWFKYYFPNWCTSEFSEHHKKWWRARDNPKYKKLALRAFRGFSKTTDTQMELIRRALLQQVKFVVYSSKSWDAASDMLEPIKLQLEENARLIQDYGRQKNLGAWETGRIILKNGVAFQAIGRNQSPRGMKVGSQRPDLQVYDDLDDDELVRSAEQIDKAWDWLTGALFPAMDFSGHYSAWFVQNLFAEDCLMARWGNIADYVQEVNILDAKGRPTWPDRFPKEVVADILKGIPEHIRQREYFNNPIRPGSVFKREWIQWKKMPPLKQYKYLVAYLDPSFSNKKDADKKAWILVGLYKGEIHVRKAFCDVASVAEMVRWGYEMDRYLKEGSGAAQFYMEEVFLQNLLYKDFNEEAKRQGYPLALRGDQRKKPDKDSRIAARAGQFERGQVFFDQAEQGNHHMQNLVDQFLLFHMGSTRVKKDGPDAFEGAVFLLEQMIFTSEKPLVGAKISNTKRW